MPDLHHKISDQENEINAFAKDQNIEFRNKNKDINVEDDSPESTKLKQNKIEMSENKSIIRATANFQNSKDNLNYQNQE